MMKACLLALVASVVLPISSSWAEQVLLQDELKTPLKNWRTQAFLTKAGLGLSKVDPAGLRFSFRFADEGKPEMVDAPSYSIWRNGAWGEAGQDGSSVVVKMKVKASQMDRPYSLQFKDDSGVNFVTPRQPLADEVSDYEVPLTDGIPVGGEEGDVPEIKLPLRSMAILVWKDDMLTDEETESIEVTAFDIVSP